MADRIYLDHAATTPMRPEAVAAVAEGMARWANPSSPHAEGRAARAALEDARGRIKAALGWTGEVILTSGASEAIDIGLGRAKVCDRLVSAVEHDAVLRAAPEADRIPVRRNGTVDPDIVQAMLDLVESPIVAIQYVNSETGVFQPLRDIAPLVKEADGVLFVDCSQVAGKHPLPDADLIAISAHKLGGPPGIGALLVRDWELLAPSGGQEFGYRGGTENLPGALGFAAALEATQFGPNGMAIWFLDLLNALSDVESAIVTAGGASIPGSNPHFPVIHAFAMPGVSAAAQLIQFDSMGFAVSAGSACSSGSLKPSHVLAAMGVVPELAASTIRVSVGWDTTADELGRFAEAWTMLARRARDRA